MFAKSECQCEVFINYFRKTEQENVNKDKKEN